MAGIDDCGIITERILRDFGCHVIMAAEQEFCLSGPIETHEPILTNLIAAASRSGVAIDSFAREEGRSEQWQQYELRLPHGSPLNTVESLAFIRHHLPLISANHDVKCSFSSCINKLNIISSLQIHLHLLNELNEYLFFKQEERLSDALKWTLGGLLHTMKAAMPVFAPDANAAERLLSGADHVPSTVCWGGNNRSVALRLPESVVPHRHIEHRVPAAHADPTAVIGAILHGVHVGLEQELDPGEPVYGDARRTEGLEPLMK